MPSLKDFMRPELKQPAEVEIPGLDIFRDEETGEIIPFRIKLLTPKRIMEIRQEYTKHKPIRDRQGKPQFRNGKLLADEYTDEIGATIRMFIESFIFPDLTSEELRNFYEVGTNEALVEKMLFRDPKTMNEIVVNWNGAHGITADYDFGEATGDQVDEAKNS